MCRASRRSRSTCRAVRRCPSIRARRPRSRSRPPAKGAYAPPLTLEQHASLTVEVAVAPDQVAETLARYRLTPAARAELDAHYREQIAGSAATRAAWDRAYQSYFAWLVANRRPAR